MRVPCQMYVVIGAGRAGLPLTVSQYKLRAQDHYVRGPCRARWWRVLHGKARVFLGWPTPWQVSGVDPPRGLLPILYPFLGLERWNRSKRQIASINQGRGSCTQGRILLGAANLGERTLEVTSRNELAQTLL